MLGASALIGYRLPWAFLVVGGIGAFLVYRLDHVLVESPEDALNAPQRRAFARGEKPLLLISASILACVAAFVLIVQGGRWWGAVLLVGALGLMYPLPVLPGGRRPKDVPLLKTALIVGCWVGGGVLLPASLFGGAASSLLSTEFEWAMAMAMAYRVTYVLPNLIAVDWLDREGDRSERAGNLVIGWSERQASVAVLLVWVLATALLAGHVMLDVDPVLLGIEMIGLTGLAVTSLRTIRGRQHGKSSSGHPAFILDVWVAFPLMTWCWWILA